MARVASLLTALMVLLAASAASAQGAAAFAGTFVNAETGITFTLAPQADGSVQAVAAVGDAQIEMTLQVQDDLAWGTYEFEGSNSGMSFLLLEGGDSIAVLDYDFDDAGQPIEESYEQIVVTRQQVTRPQVPQPTPPQQTVPQPTPPQPTVPQHEPQTTPPMINQPPASAEGVTPNPNPAPPPPPATPGALPPAPQAGASQDARLYGRWLTGLQYANGANVIVVVELTADGTVSEAYYDAYYQLSAWSNGEYTYANGVYTQRTVAASPQFCLAGLCVQNTFSPERTQHQLFVTDADNFYLTTVLAGETAQLHYVRDGSDYPVPTHYLPR